VRQIAWGLSPHRYGIYRLQSSVSSALSTPFEITCDFAILRRLRSAQRGLSSEFFRDEIHAGWQFLAAVQDQRLLGILWAHNDPGGNLFLRLQPNEIELTAVYVPPAQRGRGIAKLLIHAACVWAQQGGVTGVFASIHAGNISSQRAFEAVGFRKIAQFRRPAMFGPRYLTSEERWETSIETTKRLARFHR
jgi:RimJ/RimL family protein N-acetyltransferase